MIRFHDILTGEVVGFWYDGKYRKGEVVSYSPTLTLEANGITKSFSWDKIEADNGTAVAGYGRQLVGQTMTNLGI